MHYDADKMAKIFLACCILHNFCKLCGEPISYGDLPEVNEDDISPSSPRNLAEDWNPNLLIRNTLVEHFFRYKNMLCADANHNFEHLEFVDE